MVARIWGRGLALKGSPPFERPAGFLHWRGPRWISLCRAIDFPPGSPGVFISGAEMEGSAEIATEQGAEQEVDHDGREATSDLIASGNVRLGADDAAPAAPADNSDDAEAARENPLDIISEIEHLLRIVGNVAVHEFRRISERLADLKNHPAIKPGE